MKQAENGGAIDTIIAAEKSTGALRIVTNSDNNVYYEARKAGQYYMVHRLQCVLKLMVSILRGDTGIT